MAKQIETGLARCGDEVVVRIDGKTNLLPVRQIYDTEIYESVVVPSWFTPLWKQDAAQMKDAGFSMHRLQRGWVIRWRLRLATETTKPADIGNTSYDSDYHSWLNRVNNSMPMPVPAGI